MKKALKVTFGTMLAVSMAAPIAASAHYHDALGHVAGWIEATYMQPSNNGLSVGDYATIPTDTIFDGARNHYFIEPDTAFDYAFGLTYRFPHSHTRAFLSYDHTDFDDHHEGDINVRNLGISPEINPGVLSQTQGIVNYDLSAHEFRVGAIHDLHFGDRFCLDLLAFFEYSRVKQEFGEFISRDAGGNVRARQTENLVKGFGPGVGFMTRWYAHNPHWHVFAGANTTLLKTDNNFSQEFVVINNNNGNAAGHGYDYEPYGTDSIVGKVDIEFGVNYHCAFRREMHGAKWDVSLGMRYMNMFNVFKNGNTMYQPLPTTTAQIQQGGYENFAPYLGAAQDWGKYGPFLRFTLGGAHS